MSAPHPSGTAPSERRTRRVVVTGASGAIGAAVARRLAAAGHAVVAHANTRPARTDALVREGAAVLSVTADLTDPGAVDRMWARTTAELGPPTDLVVNAGIWPSTPTPVADLDPDRWRTTLAADLTAPFLCCRAFLRGLRAGPPSPIDDASIVLVGSTAGLFGEAGHADYAAAKAGLGGLLRSLKNEIVALAPRGRANMVSPGWVRTPMAESALQDPDLVARAFATMALRKVATPEDVAHAVAFLVDPATSGHVSGIDLPVHGGMEGRLLHPPTTDPA